MITITKQIIKDFFCRLVLVLLTVWMIFCGMALAGQPPVTYRLVTTLPQNSEVGQAYPVKIEFKNNMPFSFPIDVKPNMEPASVVFTTTFNNCEGIRLAPGTVCSYEGTFTPTEPNIVYSLSFTATYTGRSITTCAPQTIVINPAIKLIAVGDDALVLASRTGSDWSPVSMGSGLRLDEVAEITSSGILWITVGRYQGSDALILTSINGLNWQQEAAPTGDIGFSIGWNGVVWAMGGAGDVFTSPNARAPWTQHSVPTTLAITRIAWGNNQWIGVAGFAGAPSIIESNDPQAATSWQLATSIPPGARGFEGVVWDNKDSLWVVCGEDASNQGIIVTSLDGLSWGLAYTIPAAGSELNDVDWNGNQLIAVGNNGYMISSTDATAWSSLSSGVSGILRTITWDGNNNIWVVVGNNGLILTSSDSGATWISQASGTNKTLRGVAALN